MQLLAGPLDDIACLSCEPRWQQSCLQDSDTSVSRELALALKQRLRPFADVFIGAAMGGTVSKTLRLLISVPCGRTPLLPVLDCWARPNPLPVRLWCKGCPIHLLTPIVPGGAMAWLAAGGFVKASTWICLSGLESPA